MLKQTLQRGFTLIELLVVIAIIGILAAVVLTSLGGAQEGAQNSNVQQTLSSTAGAAQLYYNRNDFSYDGLCAELTSTGEVLADLADSIGYITGTADNAAAADEEVACYDDVNVWAVSAPFVVDGVTGGDTTGGYWCIDSTGTRDEIADHTTDTSCN